MSSKNIEVDISGAVAKFKAAGVDVHMAVPKLLGRLAGEGERFMKTHVPVKTGFLKNTITSNTSTSGSVIYASAPYAKAVNDGSKPHMIYPRTAKVLRFVVGGHEVFAKFVHHPGTKGVHFAEQTYNHIMRILPAETDKIIEGALKRH